MKVKIRRWGINGEGIAYLNKKAIFVDNAIPGEVVDIRITEDLGTYAKAEVLSWIEKAPRRREPVCPKWQTCGGCGLMHVDYKGQIRMKEHVLAEALRKYADYTGPIEPMIKNPNPLGYRNACKLPVGKENGHTVTGMYQKDSNIFVPLDRCLIHSRKLEQARKEITQVLDQSGLPVFFRPSSEGLMNLVLKEFDGKVHAVLITTDMKIPQETIDAILSVENVESLWQSIKEPDSPEYELFGNRVLHLGGAMKMSLQLDDLSLDLLPKSFFQLNTEQAKTLYKNIAQWVDPGSNLLVEAYSGIGAISLFAAEKAREVIGIEWIEDAVANANANALMNGKENVHFVCSDAAAEMEKITSERHINTLIVDPPRSGLDASMKEAILRDLPETLIYVSCNPSTLGKDLSVLSRGYQIEKVQPYDFFSQTPHVETAVLLRKKSEPSPRTDDTARKSLNRPQRSARGNGSRNNYEKPKGKRRENNVLYNRSRRQKSHQ